MRELSRRHNQEHKRYRHSTSNLSFEHKNYEEESFKNDQISKGLDVSHEVLQSLLNSRFQLIDLVDLLHKTYPTLLLNDRKRQLNFIEQLSQTNTGKRKF